ncbi:GntP family permease [Acetobacter sp. AN02]|uniref:GntT/GntP/DsdX family permease n=1 Tax=Acetobacter sp. AN02 TaxID=2894186 RepID=UPI00243441E8|nr:gluconate:H+ symporter [Acetobacter sp. AN02]MDG6093819.1 GntP family permease [Acetobacter sp. AN02]
MTSPLWAVLLATGAILTVVILITRVHISAFIALFAVSLCTGLIAGMPPQAAVTAFEAGAGHVLGHVAPVIALGTILGKMLAESGGADRIAMTIGGLAGRKHAPLAMMVVGLLVGLPLFFEVGLVLMIPLTAVMAKRLDMKMVSLGLPMATALSVTHAMIPPHPATLIALAAYHGDIGRTIMWGVLIGTPVALLAGPVYTAFIVPRLKIEGDGQLAEQFTSRSEPKDMPPFFLTALTVFSPVVMMMAGSVADLISRKGSVPNTILHGIGNADIALLIATLASFVVFGTMRGYSSKTILKFSEECLAPTAVVLMVVAAGGGFGHVLTQSGISGVITDLAVRTQAPLLVMAWCLAATVRLATGSATVATTTTAGIAGPVLAQTHGVSPELLVIATGAGSVAFGPLNDAGFWQIREYMGMSVTQTMRSWSVIETLIAVLGLLLCLAASACGF